MPHPQYTGLSPHTRLGGRWKLELLFLMSEGSVRWKTLIHSLPDAAPNVLTRQLRQLEKDGLVLRRVITETPPQIVEYKLTEAGEKLLPILRELAGWRMQYAAG